MNNFNSLNDKELISIAQRHLHALCADISDRSVGSGGNRQATDYYKAALKNIVKNCINKHPGLKEGLPWYQGDHSIFLQYGCPAIAVSSGWFIENIDTQDITHTPKDNLDIVNYNRVYEIALAIHEIIENLNQ